MPARTESRSTDLTVSDVAGMLGITKKEVKRLTKSGQLEYFVLEDGHYRYLSWDVQRYLNR